MANPYEGAMNTVANRWQSFLNAGPDTRTSKRGKYGDAFVTNTGQHPNPFMVDTGPKANPFKVAGFGGGQLDPFGQSFNGGVSNPFSLSNNMFNSPIGALAQWRNNKAIATEVGGGVDMTGADAAGARGLEGTKTWNSQIEKAAQESGVPKEVIAAIMGIESGGDPNADHKGIAVGLMAIVPQYWAELAKQFGGDLNDPYTNIRTGAQILKDAYDKWGSWDKAAAAYFGALDANGNITGASDAFGTDGYSYVQAFKDNLAAQGWGSTGASSTIPTGGTGGGNTAAVSAAQTLLGLPYVWGGESQGEGGFDCSGLTQFAYAQAGKQIPRTAAEQYAGATKVSADQLQPGDLIFFQFPPDMVNDGQGGQVNHVAMYVGNGTFIQATSNGGDIHYTSLADPFYAQYVVGYGRY